MSTFGSQTTDLSSSTTSSASRFSLDENSTRDILVYRVRNGYSITTQKELARELDRQPNLLRLTRKEIPRNSSRVEVQACDLQYEDERHAAEEMRNPNMNASVASIGLEPMVRLRKMFTGDFDTLYIVSQNSTRSLASSTESEPFGSGSSEENSPEEGPTRRSTANALDEVNYHSRPRLGSADDHEAMT
ncbi:MAG: hypothetical protein Q9159_004741 [Coniocarpon cinnabarinum]